MLRERLQRCRRKNHGQDCDAECAAYVLITCGQPDAQGEMQVEMTYDGDKDLASYLLANAQCVLDDQ